MSLATGNEPYVLPSLRKVSYYDFLFVIFSLYYFLFATHLWSETKGVPGYMFSNMDEFYISCQVVENWANFGMLNSGLLLDYATGSDPSSHPLVYTHNIAFPHYIAYIIRLLGLPDIYHLSFISMFFAYVGYSLAYWLFRRFINPHLGIIVFILIVLDYKHVLTHSHTFFRTFQWILFFLVPLMFLEWQNSLENAGGATYSKYYKLAFGISIAMAMAFEHAFAFQCLLMVFFLYLCINSNPLQGRQLLPFLTLLAVCVAIPLICAMVIQSIYFRDPFFVLSDHVLSYANRLFGWPGSETIQSLYKGKPVVNFTGEGSIPFNEILHNIISIFVLSFKEYGLLPFAGAMCILVLFVSPRLKRFGAIIHEKTFLSSETNKAVVILGCFLSTFIALSCLVPRYVYVNYVMAGLPMLEIYFIIFKAFILYIALSLLFPLLKSRIWHALIVIALIGIGLKGLTSDYFFNPPVPMPAYDVLPKYKGHSFSVNYWPQYPAIFTKHWAVNSALPGSFVAEENLMFKDADSNKEKYLRPEYCLDIYMKSQGYHPDQMKEKKAELVEHDWNYEIWKLHY